MATPIPEAEESVSALAELEQEVIDLFVQVARILGQPKSIGEIYGLLFISERSLPMETVMERLQISKGSASQGLKFLRNMRAVKVVYEKGDRRDHYVAEGSLKALASGFIREQVEPHLESGESRLERMRVIVEQAAEAEEGATAFHQERIKRLKNWHKRSRQLLPLVTKVIE